MDFCEKDEKLEYLVLTRRALDIALSFSFYSRKHVYQDGICCHTYDRLLRRLGPLELGSSLCKHNEDYQSYCSLCTPILVGHIRGYDKVLEVNELSLSRRVTLFGEVITLFLSHMLASCSSFMGLNGITILRPSA